MKSVNDYDSIVILHGCPPTEQAVTPKNNRWMNWLADRLNEKGFNAFAPEMPSPWHPIYSEWKKVFEKYSISQNTLLVGHSCGGAFLVRWLLEAKKKVKKLILVAPAKVPETQDDARKDLYEFELPSNSSQIAGEIVVFTSNDFPHHLKSLGIYKEALNPRVVTLENKFHFLFFQTKTNEFPELLEEIIS